MGGLQRAPAHLDHSVDRQLWVVCEDVDHQPSDVEESRVDERLSPQVEQHCLGPGLGPGLPLGASLPPLVEVHRLDDLRRRHASHLQHHLVVGPSTIRCEASRARKGEHTRAMLVCYTRNLLGRPR